MYLPSQNKEHCIVLYCIREKDMSKSEAVYAKSIDERMFTLSKKFSWSFPYFEMIIDGTKANLEQRKLERSH